MQCVICNKYSGHTSDINLDKFRIDGIDYIYPVCQTSQDGRFTEHKDANEIISEIVHKEQERQKQIEEQLKQRAKEILEKQEADSKANQERIARDNEERTYKTAMHNFHELTQGNDRAMKEIYRTLKEAFEGAEDGNKQ